MNGESIAWLAISLVVLFLVWRTIEPFVTPIIFGAAIAYILLPPIEDSPSGSLQRYPRSCLPY